MKKLLFFGFLILGAASMQAQKAEFGLKGGLNYGATGDYESAQEGAEDFASNFEEGGKNKTGFHAGVFAQFEVLGIFLRPELLYTELNTEYSTFDYKVQKIDAPVLLGLNVLGPLNIKAGPSFQYVLNNEIENSPFSIGDVEDEISVGYQLGAGLDLGRLEFDVRYEGAFSENTAFGLNEMASENFTVDSRPSQWILSLSYSL
ncbi:outer membrane beta-barrel protein [Christiangramia sabulilitoris]|uniref:PorT family protein n=1 Tax=Christiangramia sabulilitoris TaxID=2583991 RepID=A0A550HYS2_9FLAO|nr:outer membrane beta-barrel protein [Christiangramia sabulilitoris]TRO63882.1 PorT family protein [Christiangramia sabulilitoris]